MTSEGSENLVWGFNRVSSIGIGYTQENLVNRSKYLFSQLSTLENLCRVLHSNRTRAPISNFEKCGNEKLKKLALCEMLYEDEHDTPHFGMWLTVHTMSLTELLCYSSTFSVTIFLHKTK